MQMNFHKCRKYVLITAGVLSFCFTVAFPAAAYSDAQSGRNYSYDQTGKAVYISDAYNYSGSIILTDGNGVAASKPQDLYVTKEQELYIADTGNNRILMYDKNFRFKGAISEIRTADGQTSKLNSPEGVFVCSNGDILVADTQNQRIVRCDKEGNAKIIITKPSGMTGIGEDDEFLPVKVACDSIDRIAVVARNINLGIVQLDSKGAFLSYIGVPKVQPDLFTLFWRMFSTQAQKQQMVEFIATEYGNIYIDNEDFIWGTIRTLDTTSILNAINSKDTSGNVTPIRKLNSMGNDILKRNGQYAPLGDLNISKNTKDEKPQPSAIIDVALGPSGLYSLLDQTRGHIFTYDDNGNLLYAFGGYGLRKADLQLPSAMSYIGKEIAVLDAGLGKIQLYSPTAYGSIVIEAVTQQHNGNFDEANRLWSQIANQNTNFEYAFEGLGNAQLSQGEYTDAMKSFKYANSSASYSETFVLLRKQVMKKYFPIILGGFIIVIVVLILYSIVKKFLRYYRES